MKVKNFSQIYRSRKKSISAGYEFDPKKESELQKIRSFLLGRLEFYEAEYGHYRLHFIETERFDFASGLSDLMGRFRITKELFLKCIGCDGKRIISLHFFLCAKEFGNIEHRVHRILEEWIMIFEPSCRRLRIYKNKNGTPALERKMFITRRIWSYIKGGNLFETSNTF